VLLGIEKPKMTTDDTTALTQDLPEVFQCWGAKLESSAANVRERSSANTEVSSSGRRGEFGFSGNTRREDRRAPIGARGDLSAVVGGHAAKANERV